MDFEFASVAGLGAWFALDILRIWPSSTCKNKVFVSVNKLRNEKKEKYHQKYSTCQFAITPAI